MNPANESTASFRECVLIRHPRHGEYALAFITGSTMLQVCDGTIFCRSSCLQIPLCKEGLTFLKLREGQHGGLVCQWVMSGYREHSGHKTLASFCRAA